MKDKWYQRWFNEDYLKLYANHDEREAEAQVEGVIQLLSLKGGEKIIDLGCGAGRHVHQFARRGFDVTGVDQSEFLIDEAKKGPGTFIHTDVFSLEPTHAYDLALSLFTSFGYFNDDVKNLFFLEKVKEQLKNGGTYFLEYLNPDFVRKNLVQAETKMIEGNPVVITRKIEGDIVVKTIRFPEKTYQERVKLYSRKTIEEMLSNTGFLVEEVFSDYNGNDFSKYGERQVFLTTFKS